jgi:hypothetical protein
MPPALPPERWRMRKSPNKVAWLALAAALIFFGWRLFVPPAIGIADNGDFPKITGPLWLGPAAGRAAAEDHSYFVQNYQVSTNYIWNSRVYSSEGLLAWGAVRLAGIFQRQGEFDIRWMGGLHLAALLAALVWLMGATRPLGAPAQAAAAAAAIFIFGDAAYLAYCNTFYMDAAAFAGVALMVVAAIDLAIRGNSAWRVAGYTLGGLFYVTSKMQHAPMAIAAALLIVALARSRAAVASAALLLVAAACMTRSAPSSWRGEALFDAVFFEILPHSPAPVSDLEELGLDPAELRYVGLHVFSPGAPTADLAWSERFTRRLPYWRLARFYAAHPLRTLGLLWWNLTEFAWQIQEPGMGNYTRDSGQPAGAQAAGYWSGWRGGMLRRFPWIAPAWIALAILWRLRRGSRLAWVCAALAAMSGCEFVIAALSDAIETNRHLFIFHVLTEITICFAVVAAVRALRRSRFGMEPAADASAGQSSAVGRHFRRRFRPPIQRR